MQMFPSLQLIGEPAQSPLRQTSVAVQALPSSHGVRSGFAGFEQRPVLGSHVPASWHESSGVHPTLVHSQASPVPSPSVSVWSGFGPFAQLSQRSPAPSPSVSS